MKPQRKAPNEPANSVDSEEIRLALRIFTDGFFEIRLKGGEGRVVSRIFDDIGEAAQYVSKLDGSTRAVWFSLNTLPPGQRSAVKDRDVVRRRWILIDGDPVRDGEQSSSATEHLAAICRAKKVAAWLGEGGISNDSIVLADSGNGTHLLLRVDLPNDGETTDLVKRLLSKLDTRFSDEAVKIDTSVYNAGRVAKLPGTWARKGENTEERPHRRARILSCPDDVVVAARTSIETIAGPPPPKPPRRQKTAHKGAEFDVGAFLQQHFDVERVEQNGAGTKYVLRVCPWGDQHSDDTGGAAVFAGPGQPTTFHCFHEHCQGRTWKDLRALVEPARSKHTCARKVAVRHPRIDEPKDAVEDDLDEYDDIPVRPISDFEMKPFRFIAEPYIPANRLTLIAGDAGQGKSTIAAWWAARASKGEPLLPGCETPPAMKVLILDSGENPVEDTLKPKLIQFGADLDRVLVWDLKVRKLPKLGNGATDIKRAAKKCDAGLIIMDPVRLDSATNAANSGDVRDLLEEITVWAEEDGRTVVGIAHLNKPPRNGSSISVNHRLLNSVEFVNVARSVVIAHNGIFAHAKASNAAKGNSIEFRIIDRGKDEKGQRLAPGFEWGDVSETGADDLVSTTQGTKQERCAEWLMDFLTDEDNQRPVGGVDRGVIEKAAEREGFNRKLLDRARNQLNKFRKRVAVSERHCGAKVSWKTVG